MKRKIYISLVALLIGSLLFFIYLEVALMVFNRSGFDLMIFWPVAVVAAVVFGILIGSVLGKVWWKFVYIDRCGGRLKKK